MIFAVICAFTSGVLFMHARQKSTEALAIIDTSRLGYVFAASLVLYSFSFSLGAGFLNSLGVSLIPIAIVIVYMIIAAIVILGFQFSGVVWEAVKKR